MTLAIKQVQWKARNGESYDTESVASKVSAEYSLRSNLHHSVKHAIENTPDTFKVTKEDVAFWVDILTRNAEYIGPCFRAYLSEIETANDVARLEKFEERKLTE